MQISQKNLNIDLSHCTVTSLLHIYICSKSTITDSCTPMHTGALCTTAKQELFQNRILFFLAYELQNILNFVIDLVHSNFKIFTYDSNS